MVSTIITRHHESNVVILVLYDVLLLLETVKYKYSSICWGMSQLVCRSTFIVRSLWFINKCFPLPQSVVS